MTASASGPFGGTGVGAGAGLSTHRSATFGVPCVLHLPPLAVGVCVCPPKGGGKQTQGRRRQTFYRLQGKRRESPYRSSVLASSRLDAFAVRLQHKRFRRLPRPTRANASWLRSPFGQGEAVIAILAIGEFQDLAFLDGIIQGPPKGAIFDVR